MAISLKEFGCLLTNAQFELLALATGAMLAAGAEVTSLSDAAALDARSLSAVADVDAQELDTRSFTVDWSLPHRLNTKRILGTMMLLR